MTSTDDIKPIDPVLGDGEEDFYKPPKPMPDWIILLAMGVVAFLVVAALAFFAAEVLRP